MRSTIAAFPIRQCSCPHKFRLYIGLLHQAVKTRKKRGDADEGDDDDDDEDEDRKAAKGTPITVTQAPPPPEDDEGRPRKRKRLYRAIGSAYDELDADDNLSFQDKLANSLDEKDRKMERFLNNPEQSMKVFFSSFFRQRGLIWCAQLYLDMLPVRLTR